MVKQTITFSDGSETTMNFVDNPNRENIESNVAEAVAEHSEPVAEPVEEVTVETVEELEVSEEVA